MTEEKRVGKIMCMSHDSMIRNYLTRIVHEYFGYDVVAPEDNNEAFERMDGIDLLIADVDEQPAHELIYFTRAKQPDLAIIALMGSSNCDFKKVMECSDDCVMKPFQPADLENTINKYIPEHLKPAKSR